MKIIFHVACEYVYNITVTHNIKHSIVFCTLTVIIICILIALHTIYLYLDDNGLI